MARVVRPGGLVAAYLWDFAAGGFPFHPIQVEMRAMGLTPLLPPSVQASRMDVLLDLWAGAGFKNVESRVITVTRSFASFEEFWASRPTVRACVRSSKPWPRLTPSCLNPG